MISLLQTGNRALRNDDYVTAVQCYLRALDDAQALRRFIGFNLASARRQLGQRRVGRGSPNVGVCASDFAHDASRAHTLCLLYEQFANVELIGCTASDAPGAAWLPIRGARFGQDAWATQGSAAIERAIAFVAAHPYDVVHLSKPRAPAVVLGLLYKLIWASRVLVDIDDDELGRVGADAAVNVLSFLAQHRTLPVGDAFGDADWTRIAVGLADHFDGITVANPALQRRHGGLLVQQARSEPLQPDALRRAGRSALQVDDATRVVLMCSTPGNPAPLVEALAAVQSLSRDDVLLVVAGAVGNDDAQLAAGAAAGCRLLGDLPFEAMPEIFAAADVFVQLQDLQRGRFRLPASMADAMLARLPVLARLGPGVLDEALLGDIVDVAPGRLAPALRDALTAPARADAAISAATTVFGLQPNAAVLQSLCGAGAAPPAPLTPEGARLIDALQLPKPLREVLPGLLDTAPRAAEALAHAAALAAAAAEAEPVAIRHLPAEAVPEAASDADAAAPDWTRAAELQPAADSALADLLGTPLGLLAPGDAATEMAPDIARVRTFIDLHGRLDAAALQLRDASGGATAAPAAPAAQPAACGWHLQRSGWTIVDIWSASDAALRLRFEADADDAAPALRVLRGFQFRPGAAAPTLVCEQPLQAPGPRFIDVALVNPYFPILLVTASADGSWLDTVLLPFPSLARGGAHHGELAASATLPATMSALTQVSNSLLAELVGWHDAPQHLAIAGIDVDLLGANGSETLLSASLKEWLAEVMCLHTLQPEPGADGAAAPPVRDFLLSLCRIDAPASASAATRRRADERATHGTLSLLLAADSVPTIAALVSRRLALEPGADATTGGWVVAQHATGRPLAVVAMPPLAQSLPELQPRGRAACFPLLRRRPAASGAPTLATLAAPLPLALRYLSGSDDSTATLLLPVAPDHQGPLLRRGLAAAERSGASVAALLGWQPDAATFEAQVGALARQTLAAATEVVALLPASAADQRPRLEATLATAFAGRFSIVETAPGTPSALLNQAAAQARAAKLLILGPATLLHDSRTLEVLYTLSLAAGVATAACVVLREVTHKKGSEVRFHSGGMFPRQLSFHSRPSLVFDEPSTSTAFPVATYPVVANSLRLALVDAARWAELGGLDAAHFPGHGADLDFGLRALRAGFVHLCTGVVAATDLDAGGAVEYADTHAPAFLPLQRWHEVLSQVSVIRDLQA